MFSRPLVKSLKNVQEFRISFSKIAEVTGFSVMGVKKVEKV